MLACIGERYVHRCAFGGWTPIFFCFFLWLVRFCLVVFFHNARKLVFGAFLRDIDRRQLDRHSSIMLMSFFDSSACYSVSMRLAPRCVLRLDASLRAELVRVFIVVSLGDWGRHKRVYIVCVHIYVIPFHE